MSWGFHGVYNVYRCCPKSIRCPATIAKFNTELVERIDMKKYGPLMLERYGPNDRVLGYTMIQQIETSSITAHFVEETNDFYLDVFSCKVFENEVVKDVIHEFFKPTAIQTACFTRQAQPELK
jgi:S-adenosylmethionine/arginine decarboxylase-like enzyme